MRLPDAPLLEVVFELRWDINYSEPPSTQPRLGYDPGFALFEPAFSEALLRAGFKAQQTMSGPGPTIAHTVSKRYRADDQHPFPLVQIGHGLFACNLSTDYDWAVFAKFVKDNLRVAIQTYPQTKLSPMRPLRLELRYIDVFNVELLGHNSFGRFLGKDTNLTFQDLEFMSSSLFEGDDAGMLRVRRPLSNSSLGWFQYEATSAQSDGVPGVILNSRVVKDLSNEDALGADTLALVEGWLMEAHDVTKQFFKQFVSDELMRRFREEKPK